MSPRLRIAALGNSHIGALKAGWDRLHDANPDISITFFAAPGARMMSMQVKGDRLVPRYKVLEEFVTYTSGGISEVVASDYDIFMVHGMGLKLLNTRLQAPSGLTVAVRNALREDILLDNNTMKMAKKLQKIGASPVFVTHNPLSASIKDKPTDTVTYDADAGGTEAVLAVHDVKLIRTPESLRQGQSTPKRYSVGSERLVINADQRNVQHDAEDRIHMNADWGEIWMQEFVRSLACGL